MIKIEVEVKDVKVVCEDNNITMSDGAGLDRLEMIFREVRKLLKEKFERKY